LQNTLGEDELVRLEPNEVRFSSEGVDDPCNF
jgi:hypothetical protein